MTCTGIGTGNLISQSVVLWHEFLTLPRWDILYTIFTDIENLLASSFISLPKFSRKARFPSQGCDCKIFHNQFIYVKKTRSSISSDIVKAHFRNARAEAWVGSIVQPNVAYAVAYAQETDKGNGNSEEEENRF